MGTVEDLPGGASCRLLMDVETLDWAALILGAVGAEFEVLAPRELRDRLHRTGELFLRSTQ